MRICLDIVLASGRYDAGGGLDPTSAEWPPHPARVHAALRSVAQEADGKVLRQLEALPPPLVYASPLASSSSSRTYVVTNSLDRKGGHLTHPGRTSGLRERVSSFPLSPTVRFVWPESTAVSDESLAQLDSVAANVPYLGRSTSPALLAFLRTPDDWSPAEGIDTYVPTTDSMSTCHLRVPYQGYTDELEALYALNSPAWQASEGQRGRQAYALAAPDQTQSLDAVESPYSDLVVLRFIDRRPAGRLIAQFTQALRSKVMGQTVNPLPAALHGHGLPGVPHVAYLGLPNVGHANADGALLGLAVAIPGMDGAGRREILRGLLGDSPSEPVRLRVPGLRSTFDLRYAPNETLPVGATPWRWTRRSRHWATATPIVLDKYPKHGDLASAVQASLELAGLPAPASVEAGLNPLLSGAVQLRPDELPRRARGRVFCHARVQFEGPVSGPLLAGAGRYFGVGLFAQLPDQEETHA